MTDVCGELKRRLALREWHRDREQFLHWLDSTEGVEVCAARGLEETERAQDWALFEGYVNVAFRRPDVRQSAPLCAALARQTFEVNNEDIVEALGEVRDPGSVAVLAATLEWEPDWDEFRALAVKCVWALAAIGTDEAWAVLDAAAAHGPDVIREEVDYERGRRSSRGPAPI